MVPEESLDAVVEHATAIVHQMYPTLLNNDQYTAMVNARHYDRMQENLQDAEQRGIKTVTINPAGEDFTVNPNQKVPPTLIIDPDDDAICMQDEIFGPLLPIKTYKNFEDTIDYINDHRAHWRPISLAMTRQRKNAFSQAQPPAAFPSMT